MVVSDHYSIILMESSSLPFQRISTHRSIRKRTASSHAKHIKEFIKSSSQIDQHPKDETSVSAERPSPKLQHIPLNIEKTTKNQLPCILPDGKYLAISIILPSQKKEKIPTKDIPVTSKPQASKRLLDIFQNVFKNFDQPINQVQKQQEQFSARITHNNEQSEKNKQFRKDQEKLNGYFEKFRMFKLRLTLLETNTQLL